MPDANQQKATDITWVKNPVLPKQGEGIYFIRTSLSGKDENTIWTIYNTLTEIEATFRCLKTDLALRPVFHQYDENIESHLFLGLLAYQVASYNKVPAQGQKYPPRLQEHCADNEHTKRGSNNNKTQKRKNHQGKEMQCSLCRGKTNL